MIWRFYLAKMIQRKNIFWIVNFPPFSFSNVWLRLMISMFPFQHSGHTFKPIDNEYDEHVHKVMDDLGLLKRRHTELISLVQDVVGITIYIML